MIGSVETSRIVAALEQAIVERKLPSKYSLAGEKLLSQLQTALQITFVGGKSSGKSSLINMMVGHDALPPVSFGHVVELEYGEKESVVIEYEDGTVFEADGDICEPNRPDEIFRVRFMRPNESLRYQTYTEVRLAEPSETKDALIDFIAQSSTITVWCSETFDENEQRLWRDMPDHIKDHGFLALTMADRQIMKGTLEGHLDRLDRIVSDDFFDIFPVAVLQALNAREDDSATGRELWELSGGSHLFRAIQKKLSLGREEDTDRARLLLEQASRPNQLQSGYDRNDLMASDCASDRRTEINTPASLTGLEDALASLTNGAEKMLREADELGAFDCSSVLTTCLETVQNLASDLASMESASDDQRQMLVDMQESENMLLLFKIEENADAALDAVSLLLQMKKEINHRISH